MELLQIKDFRGLNPAEEYIIRSCSGGISGQLRVDSSTLISTNLKVSNYEFLYAYPLTGLISAQGEEPVHVTVLGLQGKLIGAAAVINNTIKIEGGTICIEAALKVLGVLGENFCF